MKIDALREEKSRILGQVGDQGLDSCLLLNSQMGVLMEEKPRCRRHRFRKGGLGLVLK